MFPGEASARGTKPNQRHFHPKPSIERVALLLRAPLEPLRVCAVEREVGCCLVAGRIGHEPGE